MAEGWTATLLPVSRFPWDESHSTPGSSEICLYISDLWEVNVSGVNYKASAPEKYVGDN